ncbi:ATP-binding cassette domain-containing protein [Heliobacterium gestii]|uniref:ATP-binding cassette domain-containing protein n=1 Tax=Heliomicrobium gestii TaxID=2699 RepID=A0A845L7X0_HELGE|nr:ABC transporter ATP-binding protein [Heliomicrobium gestii]MBM7866890.1 ATP-binding cassette subfamily B protein [Heliomicrobium gestii]MZP42318.1 ATP-binding cassette domain-containing protein [Heliomicrobium gestii]
MSQTRQTKTAPRAGFSPGGGPGGGPPMGMPVQKAKDVKGTLRRLSAYLRPHRLSLFTVLITSLLSTVFSIVSPKLLGNATTRLFDGLMAKHQGLPGAAIDFPYIIHILLVLAGLYGLSALFGYVQQYVMAGVAQKTVYALRQDVNEKLARLPLRYFDASSHGETLSRAVNDVDNISNTLSQSLTQLITNVVTILGVIVMMVVISPWMTLILLITLPLSAIVLKSIASRSQSQFINQQKTLGELNGHIEEMFSAHPVVKAYGQEAAAIAKFNAVNGSLYEAGWRAQFISGMIMPLMMFINNIGYVLVCVAGGLLVTRGSIEIGDVQAFIQYARQFAHPITQTANIVNVIQSTIASAERVFELLDEAEEIPDGTFGDDADSAAVEANSPATLPAQEIGAAPSDVTLPQKEMTPKGNVTFERVSFRYKADQPLIEDLTIQVKAGQRVAIVGPTGAGKTTLINLLMRFYEVDGGCITVDGVDIRRLRRSDLRRCFGMVLQDTWLFQGTIRENIAYGREGATEEAIVCAAKMANADRFIRTLPEGYATVLNEEASNISQGQKQLLTIARALLADPAILILDEATSSVDTRTEALIQKAMGKLMQGRTSFVIAHRLSTIREADLILVMDHGRVIEQGTHGELLAQDGFYAELYRSQFRDGGLPQAG